MNLGYVIACYANGSEEPKFFAIDHMSGGYGYWSDQIGSAKVFSNSGEARLVLDGSDFNRPSDFPNGPVLTDVFPPVMLHKAADVNYAQPKGTVHITIVPLELGTPKFSKVYDVEIKRGVREHDHRGWQPK